MFSLLLIITDIKMKYKQKIKRSPPQSLYQLYEPVLRYRTVSKTSYEIKAPHDVAAVFRKMQRNTVQEHVIMFCLSGSNTITHASLMFIGSANAAPMYPREIFQIALLVGASAIIIAHNHPGGSLEFSNADQKVTTRIKEGGDLVGIKLLDHLLVTETDHQSMLEDTACRHLLYSSRVERYVK